MSRRADAIIRESEAQRQFFSSRAASLATDEVAELREHVAPLGTRAAEKTGDIENEEET